MLSAKTMEKIKNRLTKVDDRISVCFDALSDHNRFKIFLLMMETSEDICVNEFAHILNITPSAASQHLKVLERAGLLNRVRMGQMTCYQIRESNSLVKPIIKTIEKANRSLPSKFNFLNP